MDDQDRVHLSQTQSPRENHLSLQCSLMGQCLNTGPGTQGSRSTVRDLLQVAFVLAPVDRG